MSTAETQETHFVHAMAGADGPPRRNGELTFAEPWERRAFGLAVALSEAGCYPWEQFRQKLIAEIRAWETDHAAELAAAEHSSTCGHPGWSYYDRWLAALERMALDAALVDPAALDRRTQEFMTTRRDEAYF